MGDTINATDPQIQQQITNIGNLIYKIDHDWQVVLTKNYGPGGVGGLGQYLTLLAGTAAGGFDPSGVKQAFQDLAEGFGQKIQEIRTDLAQRQNDLILAASDIDAAQQAATAAAVATP
jgi:hypothetical protein